MQTQKNQHNKNIHPKKKKIARRVLFWLLFALFVLIVFVILFLPVFVSSEKGNKMILAKINGSIDGTLDFSSLEMSWRRGIGIKELKFIDGTGRFLVNVKKIQTKPHYLSLLSAAPSFGRTLVDEPDVDINLKKAFTEKTKADVQQNAERKKVILPVKKIDLAVNNGSLKVTDRTGEKTELDSINSKLDLKPAGKQTSFDINLTLSNQDKQSKVSAQGQLTPKRQTGWSLEGAKGSVTVEFNDLDIESLGPFFALAGVDVQAKGTTSAKLYTEIKDGRVEKFSGSIKADNFDVAGPILKGDRIQTNTLDVNVKLARQREMINIENCDIDADWLKAQVTGTVPTTFASLEEILNSDSDLQADFDCQVGTVLSQMPATFGIKKGMQITSGSLKGNVTTSTQQGKRSIEGQANLVGLAGIVDGKNVSLSQPVAIAASVTADGKLIRLDNLDVSAAFAKLNCSGTNKELGYSASADLSKLQAELGQFFDFKGYKMAGVVTEQGKVTIDKDKIGFAGSSQLTQFGLTSKKTTAIEPKADIVFDLEYRKNDGILAISKLNTSAALGKINITDSVIVINKESKKQSQINISAESLDLEKVLPFAVMFTSLPEKTELAGIAQSDILITRKDNDYKFETENTKIKNLIVGYPGRKDFVQEQVLLFADAKADFDKKTYDINVQLTGPEIIADVNYQDSLDGNTRIVKGRADVQYDWAQVTTLASAFLPEDLRLEGKRKDSITFSSKYPADKPKLLLANLDADISSGFEELRYTGVNLGKTEPKIKIEKGLLKIEPITTIANNGKLNFAGQADTKTRPVLLTLTKPMKIIENVEINEEIAKKYLLFFNPIFADSFNVTGKTNLHCETLIVPVYAGKDKDIDTADIDIAGTFSVEQLRLQTTQTGLLGQLYSLLGKQSPGQTITVRPTKFTIKNGFVHYDDMQVDIGDNPVNFRGTIGLDRTLDMQVTLPYTLEGTTVRIGEQTGAKRITLPIKGTIDRPELDVEKFLEIQLRDTIEDIIKDQLEKLLERKL
ncbi:hypothetical protein ES703_37149 [subsurface metagenome]